MLLLAVAVLLAVLVALPIRAYGQTPRPQRPYRGLFGGGLSGASQALTLNASFGAGYNQRLLTIGEPTGVPPSALRSTTFGQASAGLAYSLTRSIVGLSASFGTAASYYPVRQRPLVLNHYGTVGASVQKQVSKRTRVAANGTATFQPVYFLVSLPTLGGQAAQDTGLDQYTGGIQHMLTTASTAGLEQTLTQRVSLSLNYSYLRSWSPSGERDLSGHNADAGFRVGLIKGLGLRLTYGYRVGFYGTGSNRRRVEGDTIDGGLDFNRSLSVSRSATLSFGTGLTGIEFEGHKQYRVTGRVRFNQEIGRTWHAGLAYNRAVGMFETFRAPLTSDALTANFGGLFSRRLQFHSSVGASIGNVGFSQVDNAFKAFHANTGLAIGLTRQLALGIDYAYYRYDFGGSVQLPSGLLRRIDGQSVRVHVNVWVPLMGRTGGLNASR